MNDRPGDADRRLDMALVLVSQGITPSDEAIDAALATSVPGEEVSAAAEDVIRDLRQGRTVRGTT